MICFDWSTSAAMRQQLNLHEGVVLKPYLDIVGKTTIGCGRNLTDVGISKSESDMLLANDILCAQKSLDEHIPWWRDLDPVRQRVMLDLCFNMGWNNLRSFNHTLTAIHEQKFDVAADGLAASKWAKQVRTRADRLIQMMRTGVLPQCLS